MTYVSSKKESSCMELSVGFSFFLANRYTDETLIKSKTSYQRVIARINDSLIAREERERKKRYILLNG